MADWARMSLTSAPGVSPRSSSSCSASESAWRGSPIQAIVVVALLALLSYYWDVGYYLDAAVAMSLLSFVATVAAARYLGSGGPFG